MKAYQHPTRPRYQQQAEKLPKAVSAPSSTQADEVPGMIQGIAVGSVHEWRVAQALDKYKIEYRYQVPVRGGRVRGGQVLDFLVYAPFARPLQVFGRHWHGGREISSEDKIKLQVLQEIYGVEPDVIFDDEIPDQPAADAHIRELYVW